MHLVLFLFLIFSDVLERFVPMANYWDELSTCLVLCWGAASFWRDRKLSKGEWINWICLLVLVVLGALGNLVHPGLQDSKVAMVKDVAALCKFPAIFLVLERRTVSLEKQETVISSIAKISRWILVATLAAAIAGRFVDLGFYTDDIRILPSFTFIFSNPTFYISSYVMIAAVLMAESINRNRLFLLLDCLLLFLAQRTKGYIFIVFLVAFILLGEDRIMKILTPIFGSEKEKPKLGRLLLAVVFFGLVFFIVGKPRLDATLAYGMTVPRVALHVVGVWILRDFFPLGSGFGTFASYLSGEYYSNIYALYGIDNIWGMTRDWYDFISDVFWPYIYGQFGIFGLLIYLKMIISIFFRQYRSGITNASRIAMMAVWIYALIATTSEAYFTNGTGVQMALLLGLLIGYGSRKELQGEA